MTTRTRVLHQQPVAEAAAAALREALGLPACSAVEAFTDVGRGAERFPYHVLTCADTRLVATALVADFAKLRFARVLYDRFGVRAPSVYEIDKSPDGLRWIAEIVPAGRADAAPAPVETRPQPC